MNRLFGVPLLLTGGALCAVFAAGCPGLGTNEFAYIDEIPPEPTWCNSIETIVVNRCASCHGAQPTNGAPSRFRLDVFESDNDTPGAGLLARAINASSHNAGRPMPPTGLIPQIERDAIALWVDQGAVECGSVVTDDVGVDADDVGEDPIIDVVPDTPDADPDVVDDSSDVDTDADDTGDAGDTDDTGDVEEDVEVDTGPPTPTLADIQTQIFTPTCADVGCHVGSRPSGGLDLSDMPDLMVRLRETSSLGYLYIDTTPDLSHLYLLVAGRGEEIFDDDPLMPEAIEGGPLPADQVDMIRRWIEAGAPE